MHIIRPIKIEDNESLNQFALSASSGLLTLTRNPKRLKQKLLDSIESFSSQSSPYGPGIYFFVLEDLDDHHIDGCSAIHAVAGIPGEEFYYKLEVIKPSRRPIENIPVEQKLLVPSVEPVENTSEICTLFLSPTSQKMGIGRLLSLGRFLYIANHRERFQKKIMAELRGVSDAEGISPFWECVGRHFCDIDYEEVMMLFESKTVHAQDLLAAYPIYHSFLPKSAQDVIGKTHIQTLPALKILQKEGFEPLDGVDICDAGPKFYAEIDSVRTVKTSQKAIIKGIMPPSSNQETLRPHFASNTTNEFRACYAEVHPDGGNGVFVDANAAEALQVSIGESICYTLVH